MLTFPLTHSNGNVVKEITYDSFGTILSDTNSSLYRKGTSSFFGAHAHLGFAGEDTNLYGYVLHDPVNFVDPEGKFLSAIVQLGTLGLTTYAFYSLAEEYLGDDACENLNYQDFLHDVRETGKNVFPPGTTHPALGMGTKAGETVSTGTDALMEIVK